MMARVRTRGRGFMPLSPGLNFRRETAEATATSAYKPRRASGSSSRHASVPDVARPSQSASKAASNRCAIPRSSRRTPISRFSVAEPSAQFMLETRTARPSTTTPLLCSRWIEPRGSSSRASTGRCSSFARRLIRATTSSFVPESASTDDQLPSKRILTVTPRRAASNAPSRNGLVVLRQRSSM